MCSNHLVCKHHSIVNGARSNVNELFQTETLQRIFKTKAFLNCRAFLGHAWMAFNEPVASKLHFEARFVIERDRWTQLKHLKEKSLNAAIDFRTIYMPIFLLNLSFYNKHTECLL